MPFGPCAVIDADDKYGKAAKKLGVSNKYSDAISELRLGSISDKHLAKLCQNPFSVYACFLTACFAVYYCLGGSLLHCEGTALLGYVSAIAENVGLLTLRLKIKNKKSVSGISGMTIAMYAITYILRFVLVVPDLRWEALDEWTVKAMSLASLLMVFDVLRSVFVTYQSTYQKDLDVMEIKYLIPGCLVFAAILHPDLTLWGGVFYSFSWTSCLYLDVMALMPQVVMMAKGGGKVEALISHFVAATVVSRCCDLWFWFYACEWVFAHHTEFNYSGWLIIFVHVVHLLLCADFMYYHVKARLAGSSLSDDLSLGEVEV